MKKTCLKCGHTAEVSEDPLAECPKCGAIYSRVEARVAHRQEKAPSDTPPAEPAAQRKARLEAERALYAQRGSSALAQRRQNKRWFTPRFAKLLFALWILLLVLPAVITAAISGTGTGLIALAIATALGIAGLVILESILVVFHIAETLDDCRQSLRKIAGSTD